METRLNSAVLVVTKSIIIAPRRVCDFQECNGVSVLGKPRADVLPLLKSRPLYLKASSQLTHMRVAAL
eukprot:3045885-Amphidinium_carterae.1